jgi:hypothetical protein
MQSITINIKNAQLAERVYWFLDHLKDDGLEIISREDMEDIKALWATRGEDSVSFEEYLKNEN